MFDTPLNMPQTTARPILSLAAMRKDIQEMLSEAVAIGMEDNLVELGLDSMQVMRLVNKWRRAGMDVSFAALMERPRLDQWSRFLTLRQNRKKALHAELPEAQDKGPFVLSDVQYAYWIGRRPDQPLGDISCHAYLEIDGKGVDPERLHGAWLRVQQHHPMLRARFLEQGEQEILETPFSSAITVHDLRDHAPAQREEALAATRARLSHRLLRVELGEVAGLELSLLPEHRTRLHFDLDLLVADVHSLHLVLRDLARAYAGQLPLAAPADWSFAAYLRREAASQEHNLETARQYWQKRLPELPGAPGLPLALQPEKMRAPAFTRRLHRLPLAAWQRLQRQAASHHLTPAMVLLTAYAEVLDRWSATSRFLINIPLFDRQEHADELAHVVADFTNLLLLAIDCSQVRTFVQRAHDIQSQFHQDVAHARYSGVQVLRDLARLRTGERTAAPVVFASNLGTPLIGPECREQLGRLHWMISQTPQVWLDFQTYEDEDGLLLAWDAVDALFPEGLVDRMFAAYARLLDTLTADAEQWQTACDLLADSAPANRWQQALALPAAVPEKTEQCLHHDFFRHAAATPERIALIDPQRGPIRYGQLADQALRVAALLKHHGVAGNDAVAITLPRGADQIAAALGILALGATYVPVGIDQPASRRQSVHSQAAIAHVLTDCDRLSSLAWPPDCMPLDIAAADPMRALPQPMDVHPGQSAYIIFTSGSTGTPKGVEVSHRAAWNTVDDINDRYEVRETDRVLAVSSLDFDLSVYDIFGLLGRGGSLVLVGEEHRRDPSQWLELIRRHQATLWNSVPMLLDMLLHVAESTASDPLPLRLALLSGDWIGLDLPGRLRAAAPSCQMVALGGATEAAIWSNVFDVSLPLPKQWQSIPYGHPLRSQAYRVVDELGRDCPDHVAGELWIGGAGLAKGYRGAPELTAERFVVRDNLRWYRTGDLGRYMADGNLEFLGRRDFQVKIRGHRIETGEIETLLRRHPGVQEAVVTAVGTPGKSRHLAAYVVADSADATLFDELVQDEDEATRLAHGLVQAGQQQAARLPAPEVREAYTQFWQGMEDLAVPMICQSFNAMGVFIREGERYTLDLLLRRCRIKDEYRRLLGQWLAVLTEEGLLHREDAQTWISTRALAAATSPEQLAARWEKITAAAQRDTHAAILLDYLRQCCASHPALLRGELNPLQLFFPEGSWHVTEALYQHNLLADYYNRIVGQIVAAIVAALPADRPVRILEIGAGTGGTAASVLPHLPASRTRYLYTDITAFFVAGAQEKFKAYPFVEYRQLDIDRDPLLQGFTPHSFDLVLAANVLHDARHLNTTLAALGRLLAPGGHFVILEGTKNIRLQMLSIGFIEGLSHFADERLKDNLPLVAVDKWQALLAESGLEPLATFPERNELGAAFFEQHVLVARSPLRVRQFCPDRLSAFLEQQVPSYMVPAIYTLLEALPLTTNGKLDRSALPQVAVQEERTGGDRAPQGPLETKLAAVWQEVLSSQPGRHDNFFELGGDSLLAIRIVTRIKNELGLALSLEQFFANPSLAELAKALGQDDGQSAEKPAVSPAYPPLVPDVPNRHEPFPLTEIQQAYLIGRSGDYVLGQVASHCYFELDVETLDLERANRAWQRLIEQHDMMRAVMLADGRQHILAQVEPYRIRVLDLRDHSPSQAEIELMRLRKAMSHQVLPSDQWPLFDVRATLVPGQGVRLHIGFDNLIFDGWSMFHLLSEWRRLYDEPEGALPELALSFRDYVLAREALRDSPHDRKDREYWFARIPELPPAPELPLACGPGELKEHRFTRLADRLDAATWQALRQKGRAAGITPSGMLLAVFAEIIAFWSKSPQFTLNLTQFDRLPLHAQVNELIGDFTSLTLLAVDNDAGEHFVDRARALQRQLWQDLDHPLVGGVQIQRELARQRKEYGGGFMPIVFTSALGVDQLADNTSANNWLGRLVYNISQTPQVWLDHQVFEQDGELVLIWDAVAGLFPENMLEQMFTAYGRVLRQLAVDEAAWQQRRFDLLPASQQQHREEINATRAPECHELLHTLFAAQVAKRPDHPAIIAPGRSLSYGQLARRSRHLALLLRDRGASVNSLIAVVMEKGWEQVVATMAVLVAGGAYLPIDPSQPRERLHHLLAEGAVRTVLTQSWLLPVLDWPEGIESIAVDDLDEGEGETLLPAPVQKPEDLAYVLYTSGSTGQPKGVMIDHRGAVNTIVDINRRFAVGPDDRVLALANLGFDLSVYDIFGALAAGAGIVLPESDAVKEPAHWVELIRRHKVSIWNSVPAMMRMLVEHRQQTGTLYPSLRLALLSGDWIPVDLPAKIRTMTGGGRVIALGGATEASIWSNAYPVDHDVPADWNSIPYGRPLANQRLYVLDAAMRLRPDWTSGQLYIGGIGLAHGYWQDADKTGAVFLRHPDSGERLYKTGDLGRYLPSGDIEFLGREDHQVKINGYRVELGEVEAAIKSHAAVREAVVTVGADNQLCAFLALQPEWDELSLVREIEAQEADARWQGSRAGAEQRIRLDRGQIDPAALKTLHRTIERMALAALARILNALGLFAGTDKPRHTEELLEKSRITPRYHELFRQWLVILVREGLVRKANDTFAADPVAWPEPPPSRAIGSTEPIAEDGSIATDAAGAIHAWLDRVEPFCVPLLRGERQALEVFFAEENQLTPESLSGLLPGAAETLDTMRAVAGVLARQATEAKPLRILHLGTRSLKAARAWLDQVASLPVHCTFSEQSLFFVEHLQTAFADLSSVDIRLLDIDREPVLQGWSLHAFDLIVADQALHRAGDIPTALANLQSLLAPGGLLLAREGTVNSHLQQLSAALLEEGFLRFTDERAITRQPFLNHHRWAAVLQEAGFHRVEVPFGEMSTTLGQTVLMAQAPNRVRVFAPELLQDFLAHKLPDYMRPAHCVSLTAFPLTGNGKIDRKALVVPQGLERGDTGQFTAAATTTEQQLAAIWADVLQLEQVSVSANFFELGGDSLLATRIAARVRDRFEVQLPLRTLFAHPTVRELAAGLQIEARDPRPDSASRTDLPPIVADPEGEHLPFPLSSVQHAYVVGRSGLYPLGRVAAHCYFEYDTVDLDLPRAEATWQRLIAHHGMLRAVFLENGTSQQILAEVPKYHLTCHDFTALALPDAEKGLAEVRMEMSHQVLPIDRWPLFDVRVSLYGPNRARIHISLDNLILDGWSMFHVLNGWSRLYADPAASLTRPQLSFRDYVLNEAAIGKSAAYQRDRAYWLDRMEQLPPAPQLPLARQPLAGDRYRFHRLREEVSSENWSSLKQRAQAMGVSPSGLLLAAYAEVLGTWSGQSRFTINLTMFNRLPLHPQIDAIVGDFTSLTLLAVDSGQGRSFAQRCLNLQQQLWEDLDHPCYSGVELLREMGQVQGGAGDGMPIVFTSALGLSRSDEDAIGKSSLGDFVYGISQTPQVLLDHQAFEISGRLLLVWDTAREFFPDGMIEDMMAAYLELLLGLATDADLWQQDEVLHLPARQRARHRAMNATAEMFAGPQLLHELFAEQAALRPDQPAVLAGRTSISYRQLAAHAGTIGRRLRAAGAEPNTLVAIVMDKGWEQVAAALGILMAGAAYLPIAADMPPERLHHVLADGRARLVCTQEHLRHAHPWPDSVELVVATEPTEADLAAPLPDCVQQPADLAYVIYTSGSTGLPKGVMIDHGGAVNTIKDMNRRFKVRPEDRILGISALHFDLSVYDLFGTLAAGATLVLPDPDGLKDPGHWLRRMREHRVTVWNSVPALMQMLVQYAEIRPEEITASLRLALLSGDWIAPELPAAIETLYPQAEVVGLGGATEASIWSICHPIPAAHSRKAPIPYGRPMANQRMYVLDETLKECPDWVRGGLYIGGVGLARGYWADAEKTKASFFMHPRTGEWLYATGDRGRYLPDGTIEFLGRDDHQVKIRGHRIELGEIETVLKSLPSLRDAVVQRIEREAANPFLAAWLVGADDNGAGPDGTAIKTALRAILPEYMVPEILVFLPQLPLTANGKVDRKALVVPEHAALCPDRPGEETATEQEAAVVAIWQQVLKQSRIDLHTNFFEAGGDSLNAVELTNAFFKAFQVELSLTELFQVPTVAGMAKALAAVAGDGAGQEERVPLPQVQPDLDARHQPFPLTDVQQAYWLGRSAVYELGNVATHTYFEIETVDMDPVRLERAWHKVVARHEMLRAVLLVDGRQRILKTVPESPFRTEDFRELGPEARLEALLAIRKEMEQQMHPVDTWPLFDIRISRIDEATNRLHLSFDALILDGWSMGIIFTDWSRFYRESDPVLPPLELSYRDYVLADAAFRETPLFRRDREYHLARLADLPPAPVLPLAMPLAQVDRPRFRRLSRRFPSALRESLQTKASQRNLTLAGVLLTAYAHVLATWSNSETFTVNVSFFNRLPLHPQVMDIVGDFTSVQLLPVRRSPEEAFFRQAGAIQQELWQGLDHRYFGGVRVLRELARQRGTPQAAIMPVVFTSFLGMEQNDRDDHQAIGLLGRMIHNVSQTPQVVLDNQVGVFEGELAVHWDHVVDVFPDGLVEAMFAAYCRLVEQLAGDEDAWNDPLPASLPAGQQVRRTGVNATETAAPPELLHELFLRQARQNPAKTAVIDTRSRLSYGELADRAEQLASLLARQGVGTNELVAVVMEKGWEQVAAVLGTLIAGAAYLPIAPDLPAERLAFLLEDGRVRYALTQPWLLDSLQWPKTVTPLAVREDNAVDNGPSVAPRPELRQDHLAYVIYTSGSTGRPKGVMIDHRGAVNTIADINRRWAIGGDDRILGLSQLHFDLSVYDIFGTLAAGATLVLPHPTQGKNPAHWLELMQKEKITVWNSVPALMRMLVAFVQGREDTALPDLRLALLSGDWLPTDLPAGIRTLAPQARLVSLGGATEASIWSIYFAVDADTTAWPSIPYGFPLANQKMHVLDQELRDCPDWVAGELYIGGIGLARGYWQDRDKTTASFIVHPQSGKRLYRTGDLGRYLPDGAIEFLGRKDFQLKINGYRIEPGEIEAALKRHHQVEEALVLGFDTGRNEEKHLVAYLVGAADGPSLEPEALTVFLRSLLPDYMIPAEMRVLAAMPLSDNGKVDRRALPPPRILASAPAGILPMRPLSEEEQKIAGVVAEVLDLNEVDPTAQFFALGANSLDIVRMQNRLNRLLEREVSVVDFFTHPSVEQLARFLAKPAGQSDRQQPPQAAGRAKRRGASLRRRTTGTQS